MKVNQNNSPNAALIDAAAGFIPGTITGGNYNSYTRDLFDPGNYRNTGSTISTMGNGYDGLKDDAGFIKELTTP